MTCSIDWDELRKLLDKHTLKPTKYLMPVNVLVDIGLDEETKARLVADGVDLNSSRQIQMCAVCGIYCSGH